MTELNEEDRKEIKSLAAAVSANTRALEASESQQVETKRLAKRANVNSWVAVGAAALAAVLTVVTILLFQEIRYVQETNCENTNNSRAVSRILWIGILDAPRDPDDPPLTEQEVKDREAFREYVNEAFADRDCDDLDRKYPEPEFPKLGGS